MKRSQLAREIVEILALTVLIFVVIRFVVQSYHMEGPTMQPTLHPNEYVLVNKAAFLFRPPARGDVIVFHFPRNTRQDYIKRIIGVPGDTVQVDGTNVWVNGVQLRETYIKVAYNPVAKRWRVPPDQFFVMDDNREFGDDSRIWDFVPKNYIVGKAVLVYWPSEVWHFIDSHSEIFSHIKGG